MSAAVITQDYLRSILDYDPETGVFRWRIAAGRWGRIPVGAKAGTINLQGYVTINLFYVPRLAHRLAFLYMTGSMPEYVDHIDRDRTNNRWSNLREATCTQNSANAKLRSDNTSGYRGVSWHKAYSQWSVRIEAGGRMTFLGYFDRKEDAVAAYENAAKTTFGDFYKSAVA